MPEKYIMNSSSSSSRTIRIINNSRTYAPFRRWGFQVKLFNALGINRNRESPMFKHSLNYFPSKMDVSNTSYTVAYSGGVTRDGVGNFSSMTWVITSESAMHLPSPPLSTGTLPSGLISRNLKEPLQ
jgi:hypothetical protein